MAAPYKWQDNLVRRGWLKILSHSELAILYAYSTSVNVRSRQTWLSAEKVAERTGLAISTVYDGLSKLRGHELIQTERREKPSNFARAYFVNIHTFCDPDKIPAAPAVPAAPARMPRKPGASLRGDVPKPQTVNGESNAVAVDLQEGAHSENADRPQTPQNGMEPATDLENVDPIREVSITTNFPVHQGSISNGNGKSERPANLTTEEWIAEIHAGLDGQGVLREVPKVSGAEVARELRLVDGPSRHLAEGGRGP